jgi:transcriptional regulator with XRE-family HTH domain
MRYAEQLRAARSLLGWSQEQLAQRAEVGVATIRRMEAQDGPIRGISETIWRLQSCLERGGVVFISADEASGPGVRLAAKPER